MRFFFFKGNTYHLYSEGSHTYSQQPHLRLRTKLCPLLLNIAFMMSPWYSSTYYIWQWIRLCRSGLVFTISWYIQSVVGHFGVFPNRKAGYKLFEIKTHLTKFILWVLEKS